ncbi:hypothetical protein GJ744_001224 [Endocarpon pusillum]|uniref:NB-ARC domain-containing protein n=1 Tax=Endocarpon pusillum TaxID=364733 RepID=A0A8H7A9U4_9EURO|nr:hypothetical protein GJ744_001224 [Endocarpon pusillum]
MSSLTASSGSTAPHRQVGRRSEAWSEAAAAGGQRHKQRELNPLAYPKITTTFSGSGNRALQVGYNAGNIKTSIYLPIERPETLPSPLSTVPFRRDRAFVPHGTLLDQIHRKCSTTASRTALVGLGGTGKSQLAIEYSYRVRDRSPQAWVFWVHASNAARFETSYRDIADQVKIPHRTKPGVDICKLVHDWLRDEKKNKWVLILDNVDNPNFLVRNLPTSQKVQADGPGGRYIGPLWRNMPTNQNGSILITTRSRSAALKLVEEDDIIQVDPMDEEHAISLFKKKVRSRINQKDVADLVKTLEYMPLAIVQAATYILRRAPRCTVREYLKKFQQSDQSRTSLLNYEAEHLRRDQEAKNSIIITWQISFDYISSTQQSAADLLSLMSFFDRQGIPMALLQDQSRYEYNERVENDILTLRDFSFISVNVDATTFEMHRLVQLATRKWLEARGQLERWRQQSIKNLSREFPTVKYENWAKCQVIFPHVKSAMLQPPKGKQLLHEWASILQNAANYSRAKGDYSDAERMSVKATSTLKEVLGRDHLDTLRSIANLALTFSSQGRWKEAEKLQVQVIETRKRLLGQEHPETLISMDNLAFIYTNQGRWKEAEKLGVQVMETGKRVIGQKHPTTLTSMANLALTYEKQGRWKEAEKLGMQVMETRKKVLGQEHPETLTSINHLSSIYINQGRWKEAEKPQMQVMETRKRVLGQKHPETLISMADLASIYTNQGRWKEAEKLGVQMIETGKRVIGQEHPSILTSMANLALTYEKQGRWKEAERLGMQVMETRKRVLGQEHPGTLTSINNLASTFWNQGQQKEAEKLYMEVMETRKRVLGQEHPSTLISMNNLAYILKEQGRKEEAIKLMAECVQLTNRVLGTKHPNALSSAATLATWQSVR